MVVRNCSDSNDDGDDEADRSSGNYFANRQL